MAYMLVLGEVLYDMLPQGRTLGGAPFNFAFHLNGLGDDVRFISRVGDDELGHEILSTMESWNMDTRFVEKDIDRRTGEVPVVLDDQGAPTFTILEDRAFDYIPMPDLGGFTKVPDLVYLGTLAQRNPISRQTIRDLATFFSGKSRIFLDLNLRAPFFDESSVTVSLKTADIVKMSEEELFVVQTMFPHLAQDEEETFVRALQDELAIDWCCVTKGHQGSVLYVRREGTPTIQPVCPAKSFVNSMGAGDAFSAMMAHGLGQGWPREKIMEQAARFAASACGIEGALPVEPHFYHSWQGSR